MNTKDKALPRKSGTSSLLRPQFSPGLLLEDDDLNTGVSYTRDLTRLLFRSLFGCGVICGLKVTGKQVCPGKLEITVAKGLALDCLGNPIEIPSDVVVEYGPDCSEIEFPIWVAVCYKESCCRPKEVACSQDDDAAPRPTRVRSGYEVRLYGTRPSCSCHCPTADDDPPKRSTGDCCEDEETPAPDPRSHTIQLGSRETEICSCYLPHFNGECECGCNCCCVVIGKVTALPTRDSDGNPIAMADREATVDYAMVRRIRPMLNGYVMCKPLRRLRRQDTDDMELEALGYDEQEPDAGNDDEQAAMGNAGEMGGGPQN
jgi:hypothetical protein